MGGWRAHPNDDLAVYPWASNQPGAAWNQPGISLAQPGAAVHRAALTGWVALADAMSVAGGHRAAGALDVAHGAPPTSQASTRPVHLAISVIAARRRCAAKAFDGAVGASKACGIRA